MATLSQMCTLPEGWGALAISNGDGMNKKMAWKIEKRKQHERLIAHRKRERKRVGIACGSLERSRMSVYRESLEAIGFVVKERIFEECKTERSPKKAKNRASKEQAGTIGRHIVVKRFNGSRLTCVCKSRII